jgi:hypothetical protein
MSCFFFISKFYKNLLTSNKQVASDFIATFVLPILHDEKRFNESIGHSFTNFNFDSDKSNLWKLISLLVMSGEHDQQLKVLFDSLKIKEDEQRCKSFLNELLKKEAFLRQHKSAFLNDFIIARKRTLEQLVKQKPEFSWRMPRAALPSEYAEIESFLKSEQESKQFEFVELNQAMRFVELSREFQCGISAKLKLTCVNGQAFVEVTKTKKYYNSIMELYDKVESELTRINVFLQRTI